MTREHGWPYQGFIQKTINGWVTWKEEPTLSANTIRNIFANDSSAIFGIGWDGTIVKYTGDIIQSIPAVKPTPSLQCHPNPFSESTGISIHLSEQQPGTIDIFDQRGMPEMIIRQRWYAAGEQTIQVSL